jgi:hypothetical protein
MIRHVWTVLCSHALIDRDSNNISIHNVLEQLNVRAQPQPDLALDLHFEIVSLWIRESADTPVQGLSRITLIDPHERRTPVSELKIDLVSVERARHRVLGQGLQVAIAGRYDFLVELQEHGQSDWREVALIPLTVVFTALQGDLESS